MHQDLKHLRRRLREERCPASVLQKVYRQMSVQRAQRKRRYVRLATLAAAALILMGPWSASLIQPPQRHDPTPGLGLTLEQREQREQRHAVRMQAGLALAYIGRALNRAGDESREIILDASLPPLRQSLRTAGEIISNPKTPLNPIPEDINS